MTARGGAGATGGNADRPRIGLIAGHGQLPVLVARGMRSAGFAVHVAGLRGEYADELADELAGDRDSLTPVGIARMGSWIRVLRRAGVHEAVMVGGVAKRRAHARFRVIRLIPDLRSALIWYRRLRHDRRNAALLAAVADELATAGITLIDSTTHIQDHMAGAGVMGAVAPSAQQRGDIEFGGPILAGSASLDIGQSIAVSNRDVIAVEAVEGTAAMIQRAGELCRGGGWTLMKTSKPGHDMRADVPTVGVETIRQLAEAKAGCLALGAGRVIMIDRPAVIAEADARGIAVVGVEASSVAHA